MKAIGCGCFCAIGTTTGDRCLSFTLLVHDTKDNNMRCGSFSKTGHCLRILSARGICTRMGGDSAGGSVLQAALPPGKIQARSRPDFQSRRFGTRPLNTKAAATGTAALSGKSEIRTRDRIKSYTSLAGTRLRPARPSSHSGTPILNKSAAFFKRVTGENHVLFYY